MTTTEKKFQKGDRVLLSGQCYGHYDGEVGGVSGVPTTVQRCWKTKVRTAMKLKAIEKICKASGGVLLFDEAPKEDIDGAELEPRQWMSDGVACYPLDGLPYLDEESVCAIFDVDAKKRDKLVISHKPCLPGGMDFTDLHPGDSRLEAMNFKMSLGDDELYLFRDEDGALLVIKSVYRKPFDSWKEVECYKRLDKDGRPYVAVMSGCILRGIIYPYKIGEQLVETLGAVYNAAGVAAEGEQMSNEQGCFVEHPPRVVREDCQ